MKRVAIAASLAFVAFLVWGIVRAGRDERPPPSANTNITLAHGRASGQRIKFKSWTADYDRIVSNADQTILDVRGVHDGTIFRHGKPYLRVRADHLSVNTITKDFSASGPVHAETIGKGPERAFDTTSATWNDATQKLTLARRVVIHSGPGAPLVVGSLTVDVKSGQIEMHDIDGPVRAK